VEVKMKGKKMSDVVNRIYVAEPRARDHKERPPVIPQVSLVCSVVFKDGSFVGLPWLVFHTGRR
jgi:hypothetical protein